MREADINTPEQMRKIEQRAKNRDAIVIEDFSQLKMKEITDFDRNPIKVLKESYARGIELSRQKDLYRFYLLLLLAKLIEK